jgi:hypothetical protein
MRCLHSQTKIDGCGIMANAYLTCTLWFEFDAIWMPWHSAVPVIVTETFDATMRFKLSFETIWVVGMDVE